MWNVQDCMRKGNAMAENKKSFVMYCDQQNVFKMLPDDVAGKLIKHIFSYVNDEYPETEDLILQLAFEPIKMQLKRDLRDWEDKKDSRSTNGKIGNLKRWNPDLYQQVAKNEIDIDEAVKIAEHRKTSHSDISESPRVAKIAVNDNVNVTVNVNDNNNNNLFDDFWDAYPNKVGKIHAAKIFNKLPVKIQEQVILHTKQYAKWKPFENYNHANPATYLNQNRYLDELPNTDKSKNDNLPNPKWLVWSNGSVLSTAETEEQAKAILKNSISQYPKMRYEITFDPDYRIARLEGFVF